MRVARRLAKRDWVHACLKHEFVGQNLPTVTLVKNDAHVLLAREASQGWKIGTQPLAVHNKRTGMAENADCLTRLA
jgi:hypothetical protein